MTAFEVVIWNLRVEMVNVMVADVSRKPLENPWKVVVTAACHGGSRVVPIFAGGPIRVFELMLDIKQPEAKQRSNRHHGELDNQPRKEAENHAHTNAPDHQSGVHDVHRASHASFRLGAGKSLKDDKQDQWAEDKENDGISNEPITQLKATGSRHVLLNGEGPNVTDTATVKIAVGRMVAGMFPTPLSVRSEREHAGDETNNAVRALGFEKRTMTAIVEDDECANKEETTQECGWNAKPQGDVLEEIQRHPDGRNGDQGVHDLPNGFTHVGLLVFSDEFFPLFVGRAVGFFGC